MPKTINFTQLSLYLGTDVKTFPTTRLQYYNGDFLSIKHKVTIDFFGFVLNLDVGWNDKKEIDSFNTVMQPPIDSLTFLKLIEFYGEPKSILALDQLLKHEKSVSENFEQDVNKKFEQKLEKRPYSTKETTIYNNPHLVIWEFDTWKLEIRLFEGYDTSQIRLRANNI